jgi:hypothetical protein
MSFLDELRRRHVVRVALVYAATGFVVLQAADLIASGLALPPWIFAAATVVTILGFPVAVVLAWAFQITPHRVQRTGADNGDAERWLSRRTVAAVGVALLLVLAGGWFINPVVSERLARTAVNSRPAGPVIASLLPPPGETWDRGMSFAVSPDGRTVAMVGFDEGGSGSRLSLRDIDRFTTRVLPTTRGADLPFWSPDGRAIGFFADDHERRQRMFMAGTRSVDAYEAFLRGRNIYITAHEDSGSLAEANRGFERALELDPRFGRAALLHADPYALGTLAFALRAERDSALQRARRAALLRTPVAWPQARLLRIYHELGEAERVRELARQIDALPTGPSILAVHVLEAGRALTFDIADAPAFAARLREAGVDPGSLRMLPRLSGGGDAAR